MGPAALSYLAKVGNVEGEAAVGRCVEGIGGGRPRGVNLRGGRLGRRCSRHRRGAEMAGLRFSARFYVDVAWVDRLAAALRQR